MAVIEITPAIMLAAFGFVGIIASVVFFYLAYRKKPVLHVPDPSLGYPAESVLESVSPPEYSVPDTAVSGRDSDVPNTVVSGRDSGVPDTVMFDKKGSVPDTDVLDYDD